MKKIIPYLVLGLVLVMASIGWAVWIGEDVVFEENVTMGKGEQRDMVFTFNGNVEDFYCGIDDSADDFICGIGSVMATTPFLTVSDTGSNIATVTVKGQLRQNATETADHTLTLDDCGSVQFMGTAGLDLTLPAATAGCEITFVMKTAFATTDMTVVTASSANIIQGTLDVNAADVDCANEDTVSFANAAETVGDFFTLISDGTNWLLINSQGSAAGSITCSAT